MVEREVQQTDDPGRSLATPGRGFFDGGDRRTHLEQLRHLSQWSRRVLLVTGPRGVGKSALYRQLSATLEPRAKAARINGSLIGGAREVLSAMVQGFGLAAPSEADTQLLRQLIAEHARAQERSVRFCVTLIDDAELLEPKALEYLMELAVASPMRVVLFGEVRLVPAVERLADPRGIGWHEIRLTGFGVDEVRAYLEWRLREQGEAMPFTDAQIREIARLSEGLPGRIDQMANVLLARIRSAGEGPELRRFPALHKALLAVLVVGLAFAYLVWQPAGDGVADGEGSPGDLARTEPIELPARPGPPGVAEPATVEPLAEAVATNPAGSGPAGGDPAAGDPAAGDPAAAAVVQGEPAAAAQSPAAPVEAAASEEPAEAQAAAEAAAAEAAVAETPAAPGSAKVAPEDEREPRAGPAAGPTAAAEPPQPEAGADTGARDAAWILRQPAGAFTLQLASFSTAERADAYLAEQAEPEDFARYRLQRNGRILHVVVYGRFDDRAAAEQAATRLPASVGRVQPWIRTFEQVQGAVRTALQ